MPTNNYLIADVEIVVVAKEAIAAVVEDRKLGQQNWLTPNERPKLRPLPSPTPDSFHSGRSCDTV